MVPSTLILLKVVHQKPTWYGTKNNLESILAHLYLLLSWPEMLKSKLFLQLSSSLGDQDSPDFWAASESNFPWEDDMTELTCDYKRSTSPGPLFLSD